MTSPFDISTTTETTVYIDASNAAGIAVSSGVSGTPNTLGSKPTLSLTPGINKLTVNFLQTSAGTPSAIYYYYYSSDVSSSIGPVTSPFDISYSSSSTEETIYIDASNAAGHVISSGVTVPPVAPVITTVSPGNGFLTIAFTTTMLSITSIKYQLNGTGGFLTAVGLSSPIMISGLANDTNYTVELQTVNAALGTSATSTASSAVAPNPPAAPIITSIAPGNNFLKVAFTTTMTSVTAILYRLNGTGPYVTATETTSPITITGLTNGTDYMVELQAINVNNGTSVTSALSAAVAPVIPAAPAITSVSPGNGLLSIAFTTTMTNITSIQYRLNGTGPFITAAGTASPIQITGLTNGTDYTVELQTVNADNGMSASSPSSAATAPSIPPAPTITSVTPISEGIAVFFTNAMASVTSVLYRLNGNGSFLSASGFTSPITITGLTNGTDYTVELQTANADNGTSDTSIASATVMPSVPPAAPVVSFHSWSDVTTTSATLNLTIDYGSSYTYTYSIDGTNYRAATVNSNALALQFTNADMVDGSSYNLTLIARNGTNGSFSTASPAVTLYGPSFTPTLVAATPNADGTVTVALSSHNTSTDNVYRYVVTDVNNNATVHGSSLSFSSSSLLLCGLLPTRSYRVVLQTFNKQTSLVSGSSNAVTFSTYAFPPQITYVRVTSTTTATVSFQNNTNNVASAMTGYQYACSTDPLVPSYVSIASTATSFSLTDLSASVVYYLTMTATTALGNSVPSAAVPFALTHGTMSRFGGGGGGGATNGATLANNGGAGGGGAGGSMGGVAGLGGGGGGADGVTSTVAGGGRGGSGQIRVTLGTAALPTIPFNVSIASVTSTSASVSFNGNGNDTLTYSVATTALTPIPVTSGFDVSAATQTNTFGATAGTTCAIAFAYQRESTPNRLVFLTSATDLYYASVSGTDTLDVNTPLYVVATGQTGAFGEALVVTPNASRLALTIGGNVYFCDTAASLTTGAAALAFTPASVVADYLSLSTDGTRLVVSANDVLKWADYDAATGNFGAFTNTLHTGVVNVRSLCITGDKEFLCYSTSAPNAVYWSAWNHSNNYAYGTPITSSTVGSSVRVAFLGQTASAIIAQADSPVGFYLSYWAGPATGYTAFASIST